MKGSPMQRNFGIGSPTKLATDPKTRPTGGKSETTVKKDISLLSEEELLGSLKKHMHSKPSAMGELVHHKGEMDKIKQELKKRFAAGKLKK